MTVRTIGNHGSNRRLGSQNLGLGGQHIPVRISWVSISADTAGDVYVWDISNIGSMDINQGIFFQPTAAMTVDFTLSPLNIALDPDPAVSAGATWGNSLDLTAPDIVRSALLFTAIKITFTEPGTLYIGIM